MVHSEEDGAKICKLSIMSSEFGLNSHEHIYSQRMECPAYTES